MEKGKSLSASTALAIADLASPTSTSATFGLSESPTSSSGTFTPGRSGTSPLPPLIPGIPLLVFYSFIIIIIIIIIIILQAFRCGESEAGRWAMKSGGRRCVAWVGEPERGGAERAP
jgi:hypothetical protein